MGESKTVPVVNKHKNSLSIYRVVFSQDSKSAKFLMGQQNVHKNTDNDFP